MSNKPLFAFDLPDALSFEETVECVNKCKEGDLDAREKLINHNIRRVVKIVKTKFDKTEYDMEELVQVGIIGLMKAVDSPKCEPQGFLPYSKKCIENEILLLLNKRKGFTVSLEESILSDEKYEDLTYKDSLEDESVNISEDNLKDELSKVIANYVDEIKDPRDREIVKRVYGFGYELETKEQIGLRFNLSGSRISKIALDRVSEIAYRLCREGLLYLTEEEKKKLNFDDIERKLQNVELEEKRKKDHKRKYSIYDFFEGYTKEEIDTVIEGLSDEDKELIRQKNEGETLTNKNRFYAGVVTKIKRRLNKLRENDSIHIKPRKVLTIYELFEEYSREEVDYVIEGLSYRDAELLYLRYGDDLDNPVTSKTWTKKLAQDFYTGPIVRMRSALQKNRNNGKREVKEKIRTDDLDFEMLMKSVDKYNMKELFKIMDFRDIVIITLALGYADDRYHTVAGISRCLRMKESEVVSSIKRILELYKHNYGDIEFSVNEGSKLTLKRD